MPPQSRSREQNDEGRWHSAIFGLQLWQFLGALVLEGYMILGMFLLHCLFKAVCEPLQPLDGLFISFILLNFFMLILIWNEMLLWTQESLSVNRFLYSELLKMVFVLPLYVYIAIIFVREKNKWNGLSVWIWTLVVIPAPFFVSLGIAIVAKYKSRRSRAMVTDEETPLLTQGEEPTAQDPAPQESAPQEPASNEPDIGNIQPSDGE